MLTPNIDRMILLKNGRLIDPANGIDDVLDLRIGAGRIAEVGANLTSKPGDEAIDCSGLVVAPGFIDPHVHFREPGFEQKETLGTGSAAAAAGGYTTVICEPNTNPPRDTRKRIDEFYEIAARDACIRVLTKACLTEESRGLSVSAILRGDDAAGVAAASDDGNPVLSGSVMTDACRVAGRLGLVVSPHCEDSHYSIEKAPEVDDAPPGLRHDFTDEPLWVARDIECAREAGARLHVGHISLKAALDLVLEARGQGQPVTCEVTPHHLILTADDVAKYGPNARMCPPLRSARDVAALRRALADGHIDCIATDHAPHTAEDKAAGANGIIGLETAFGLLHAHLVESGVLTLPKLIELMTVGPARIFGLPYGTLAAGACADVVVIDPDAKWDMRVDDFKSKSRNCPFIGWSLRGRPVMTIAGGRAVAACASMREGGNRMRQPVG